MPTDLVIKEGTSANELYVIGDGQLQVSRSDGLVVAVLGRGNFFGEIRSRTHLALERTSISNASRPPPRPQPFAPPPRSTPSRGSHLPASPRISPHLPVSPQARWRSSTRT